MLVYFDPVEKGARTKLYDVNRKRKIHFAGKDFIGDGADPFVRKMEEDEIPKENLPRAMAGGMSSQTAAESLKAFINFAIDKFEARKYILFLVGHGQVVGNDAFLPDDDPISSIKLAELSKILEKFPRNDEPSLQLLFLHSCSMSSIEVAYELKGQAKYMIATQGNTFVNSCPFRQFFKKTLNQVSKVKNPARVRGGNGPNAPAELDVQKLVEKLYFLCMHNSTDFVDAGYSADLVLCNLDPEKLVELRKAIEGLVGQLTKHLGSDPSLVKDLILLAHLESQSFYSENYTDLYDFCACLAQRCENAKTGDEALATDLEKIAKACENITGLLSIVSDPDRSKRFDSVIVHADNFGSQYQYARGFSIYFPWSEPRDTNPTRVESQDALTKSLISSGNAFTNYQTYLFNEEAKAATGDSWAAFLKAYFDATLRAPRLAPSDKNNNLINFGLLNTVETSFMLALREKKRTPELKRTPEEGAPCLCPSIKNYPDFSITVDALEAFRDTSDVEEEEEF